MKNPTAGDPLYPFLLIIAADFLSRLVFLAKEANPARLRPAFTSNSLPPTTQSYAQSLLSHVRIGSIRLFIYTPAYPVKGSTSLKTKSAFFSLPSAKQKAKSSFFYNSKNRLFFLFNEKAFVHSR